MIGSACFLSYKACLVEAKLSGVVGRQLQSREESQSLLTTTPPSNMHPTIVVPVLVALGNGTPLACNAALRVWLEKSKPGMLAGLESSRALVVNGFCVIYDGRYCQKN